MYVLLAECSLNEARSSGIDPFQYCFKNSQSAFDESINPKVVPMLIVQ